MVRVRKLLTDRGLWGNGVMVTMNQHDSLTFEVRSDIDPNGLRDMLQSAVVFPVRGFPVIRADWEIGQRWGSSRSWDMGVVAEWDGETWVPGVGGESEPPEPPTPLSTSTVDAPEPEVPAPTSRLTVVPDPEPDDSPAGHLIIELADMPDEDHLRRLIDLLSTNPGNNTVTLRTPEGDAELPLETRLSESDRGRISMAAGGARVYRPAESVDLSALAGSIDF
jgi:hypothetical protein